VIESKKLKKMRTNHFCRVPLQENKILTRFRSLQTFEILDLLAKLVSKHPRAQPTGTRYNMSSKVSSISSLADQQHVTWLKTKVEDNPARTLGMKRIPTGRNNH
jgi:hypothetical protein